MTFATHYNVGTVTVTAASDGVAGVGTFWNGNIAPGDILWVGGVSCRILTVNSNTSLTLARPWPGPTAAGAYYEAWAVLDAVGYQKKTGELLAKLAGGNLDAFAGLAGAADRLPYFNGSGSMALTPFTALTRSLLNSANEASLWTTIGATSPASAAFRRGNVLGTVSQSSGVPTGALIERGSNANGDYVRFADGTQICAMSFTVPGDGWTTAAWGAWFSAGTFPLPATFAAAPSASVSVRDGAVGARSAYCQNVNVATSQISSLYLAGHGQSSAVVFVYVILIGRWF